MAKGPFIEDWYDDVLDDYARALGRVAHSWNHLHEMLGALLARTLNLPFNKILPIWYSSNNDRAQRMMIRAALESNDSISSKQKSDIEWVLNQVDKLSTLRNIAIHAPCDVSIIDDPEITHTRERVFVITARFHNGNPRAYDLVDKDIVEEFRFYERRTETLRNYASAVAAALRIDVPRPWPERPLLPERTQATMSLIAKHLARAKKKPF